MASNSNFSRRTVFALAALVLGGVVFSGLGAQTAGNYVIGAQDVLAITVLEDATLTGRYTVEADGDFTFPLIGRIKAGGLTTRDFENALKKRLADGFFKNPQVTVAIEQYRSQRIFMSGEVRQPGMLPLTGGMTIAEAMVRAGSTMPSASGEIAIVRRGKTDPIRLNTRDLEAGETAQNIELQDGDQIYVLRAESLYVFGEVKSPGAFPVQGKMTVLQALSLAGGITPNGAINRIKIVRIVDGKRVDLNKVKTTDLVRPGDTIIVPERYF